MELSLILPRLLRHLAIIGLNILALMLYLFSWLFLLMSLFSVALSSEGLFNVLSYAVPCALLFGLAVYLRRYLRKLNPTDSKRKLKGVSYAGWAVLILLTVFVVLIKFTLFPSDLSQLASQRRSIISQQIIPAMKAYRQVHQRYPDSLQGLVPDYLPALPEALDNRLYPKRAYQITYGSNDKKDAASIWYRDCMGPASISVPVNISMNDRFRRNLSVV